MNKEFQQDGFYPQLAHLIEECGEVVAAAGKTIRFGAHSVNPMLPKEQQVENIVWLQREIMDVEIAIARIKATILEQFPTKVLE